MASQSQPVLVLSELTLLVMVVVMQLVVVPPPPTQATNNHGGHVARQASFGVLSGRA